MFSNVKPLPKILALLAIVGLVVFGASKFLDSRPKTPEVPAVVATTVPAESAQASAPAHIGMTHPGSVSAVADPRFAGLPQPGDTPLPNGMLASPPAAPVAGLTPANGHDAGLTNVLNAGKK